MGRDMNTEVDVINVRVKILHMKSVLKCILFVGWSPG